MTMLSRLVRVAILSIAVLGATACSDYDTARRAYEAGQYKKALSLLEELANKGDTKAQFELAMMYSQGVGTPVDAGRAVYWLSMSAQGGNTDAMVEIGVRYEKGFGAPVDPGLAFEWFRRAAAAGNLIAAHKVAIFYEAGQAVPKDLARAYAWYKVANNAAGRQSADTIFRRLDPEEKEKAERLLKALSKNPAAQI